MRLLITRPEPDASRTAQALRARGHGVLVAPVLVTQPVEASFVGSYDAVLMTSANAARALGGHPRASALMSRPCFTVGVRSAEAARAMGFTEVVSADGAMGDLIKTVATRFGAPHCLLYVAGEDRAGDLASALGAHGITVETVVIYRAVAAERIAAELKHALDGAELDGAVHYSPRSADTLLRLAREAGALHALLGLAHYCLSDAVAAALRDAGATRISIATQPDETALIALL